MTSFIPNLGGPGWIKDILDLELTLDNSPPFVRDQGSIFTIPSESYSGHAPLYDSKSTIKGKVIITSPPDCTIFTQQIGIRLNESVTFVDPYITNELQDATTDKKLSESERYIDGRLEFPFEIDLTNVILEQGKSGELRPFVDDYVGGTFGIKHALIVTVERPFYTFPVEKSFPVSIYTVDAAPVNSRGRVSSCYC